MKQYRLKIFLVISAAYIISYFHRAAPAVVGPELANDLGFAPEQIGLIGSMYFWAYALTGLPSGILSDTWGARKTVSAFVLLAAFGSLFFGLASSAALLSIGRFAIGLGVGVVYVAALKIFSEWYRPDELATCSGILLGVGNVGALLSTAPLVLFMGSVGWRYTFVGIAGLTLVLSWLSYKIIRNRPSDMGFAPVQPLLQNQGKSQTVTLKKAVATVFSNKKIYLLGALLFSYYGALMGVGSLWAGPFMREALYIPPKAVGGILMMFPLGMILGCPLAGYLSDKILHSRKKVLLFGGVLHLSSYCWLVFYSQGLSVSWLHALFFWYGLTGSAFVACFACAKEIYQTGVAGTAVGAINTFLFLGGAFYQFVIGLIIGRLSDALNPESIMGAYRAGLSVPVIGLVIGLIIFSFFKEASSEGYGESRKEAVLTETDSTSIDPEAANLALAKR